MIACQKCNIHIVKYLMKCGVSTTEKDCVSLLVLPTIWFLKAVNYATSQNGYSCLHYKETLENFGILTAIVGEGGGNIQCDIPTDVHITLLLYVSQVFYVLSPLYREIS